MTVRETFERERFSFRQLSNRQEAGEENRESETIQREFSQEERNERGETDIFKVACHLPGRLPPGHRSTVTRHSLPLPISCICSRSAGKLYV